MASPAGDWPPAAAASPVKGKAALPESDAGASVSGSSEAKVDDGNIQEAESSLREGLSLNYEVSKSLCPLPLVLGLIGERESSYLWCGLGEMGWEDGIFVVNASPCGVLCCALGGNWGSAKFCRSETTRSHEMAFLCLVSFISFGTWKGTASGRSMLVLFMGRSDHPHGMFFRTSRGLV